MLEKGTEGSLVSGAARKGELWCPGAARLKVLCYPSAELLQDWTKAAPCGTLGVGHLLLPALNLIWAMGTTSLLLKSF